MAVTTEQLQRLTLPFHPHDIEWRAQSAKVGKHGPWIQALAYVTNRAIMDRLDAELGPTNWQNSIIAGAEGVVCGIGINTENGWIWKTDGANYTDVESFKGGISGSMKRAAVQWGMGRYLYEIKTNFGIVYEHGRYEARTSDQAKQQFRWSPPALPSFAIPDGVLTLEQGLALLRSKYNDIPDKARIRVAKDWFNIKDLLSNFTSEMKEDYLLVLDIVEEVQRLTT